jgi:hypothetical protein
MAGVRSERYSRRAFAAAHRHSVKCRQSDCGARHRLNGCLRLCGAVCQIVLWDFLRDIVPTASSPTPQ